MEYPQMKYHANLFSISMQKIHKLIFTYERIVNLIIGNCNNTQQIYL